MDNLKQATTQLNHVPVMFLNMGRYQGDDTTGFSSPAQDYVEAALDLAAVLDLRRPELYPVRVIGQSLPGRDIRAGDILITNAAADRVSGQVCVAFVHGDVVLATLTRDGEGWCLVPSNGTPIAVSEDVEVWAAVKALVRTKI